MELTIVLTVAALYVVERAIVEWRRHVLSTMPYDKYRETPEWKAKRERKKKQARYRCQVCNSPEELQTHHRTYERLGYELVADLTALCRRCHHGVTDMLRGRRYALLAPRMADTVFSIQRPVVLFDHSRAGASS